MSRHRWFPLTVFSLLTGCALTHCSPPTHDGPAGMRADFTLFTRILRKTHAGLYDYHTPRQVDSVFRHYAHQITDSTDQLTFFRYVSATTAYLGSLHDDVHLPGPLVDSLRQQQAFFPIPVRLLGDSLVADARSEVSGRLPAGVVITAINGIPTSRILNRLYDYYTTDGDNRTGKQIGINRQFSWFFRLTFGPARRFVVRYHPCGQAAPQQVTLAAVPYVANQRLARYASPDDTLPYRFQLIDSLLAARLTVNTFELGNAKTNSHRRYVRFLNSCFYQLRKRHIAHLIVDIRQNGGGDDPNDLVTFSYLAHQPFRENRRAFTLFRRVPFPQYYVADETGERAELEAELRDEFSPRRNGRYNQKSANNPLWQPNRLAFRGKVYLLTGPAVASAAALFASLVASEEQAVIIGQETMGGYYGHTGHKSVTHRLPYTGLRLTLSIVNLRQAVRPLARIRHGQGVIPTVPVAQTCQAFLRHEDAELQTALRMIRTGQ